MIKYILKLVFIWAIVFAGNISCESQHFNSNPIIIGHRGLPPNAPENTKEGFDGLLVNKIFNVETDVLMTNDHQVILFHDVEVSRLTGYSGFVSDFSAETLIQGIYLTSGGTGLTLPEFFKLYENKFELMFIDIKQGQADLVYLLLDKIIHLIKINKLEKKVILTSTEIEQLEYIQKRNRDILLAIDEDEVGIKSAVTHGFPYALIASHRLSKSTYSFAKSVGVKIITYGNSTVIEYQKSVADGCDGVMTDIPLELKKITGN